MYIYIYRYQASYSPQEGKYVVHEHVYVCMSMCECMYEYACVRVYMHNSINASFRKGLHLRLQSRRSRVSQSVYDAWYAAVELQPESLIISARIGALFST